MSYEYFHEEMKKLLQDEYPAFVECEKHPMYHGIRINTLKTDEAFLIANGFELNERSAFDKDTFYLDINMKLGNHPFHSCGLYYLQEPSAASVVNAGDIKEGDWVLDMCAAPGGKSTSILSHLNNTGFLWSNEYVSGRSQILLSNIERWGSDNYIISNCDTSLLSETLYGLFDKVFIDAPCSGAAMFKKYPDTVNDYNLASEMACQKRQLEILENGYKCLKENGILIYSTCTYNTIENEDVIRIFTERHPDMEIVPTGLTFLRSGFGMAEASRIFPMDKGEGHFICKLIRKSANDKASLKMLPYSKNRIVDDFIKDNYLKAFNYTVKDDKVYFSSQPLFQWKGRIVRQGILIGEIRKNRFEPAHHGYMSIYLKDIHKQKVELSNTEAETFLRGESVQLRDVKGYAALTYKGHIIGFGKGDNRQIKNHFPKGLRFSGDLD